jgi:hypothetical protein
MMFFDQLIVEMSLIMEIDIMDLNGMVMLEFIRMKLMNQELWIS